MNDIFNQAIEGLGYDENHSLKPLTPNFDEDKQDLAEFDLSEKEQEELLQILWDITYQFALMGKGMESSQIVMNSLFQSALPESSDNLPNYEVK